MDNLEREKLINKEIRKLRRIYKNIGKDKFSVCEGLIENAAYMRVKLLELQEDIDENGATEFYQNGKNQTGTKPSSSANLYNKMISNYNNVIKQLNSYLPSIEEQEKAKKDNETDLMMEFLSHD